MQAGIVMDFAKRVQKSPPPLAPHQELSWETARAANRTNLAPDARCWHTCLLVRGAYSSKCT
jgi:hypothetical protein